jgi:hypothetical protein
MSSSDRFRLLNSRALEPEEILALNEISFNFPYNFAEPPVQTVTWSLADFLTQSRFPLAQRDVFTKWGYQEFSLERFARTIDPAQIALPGYLAAVTVGKLIAYALLIAESTAESLAALFVDRDKPTTAESIIQQIVRLADKPNGLPLELSPWHHFLLALRHPEVRSALNNAMINRWGLKTPPPVSPLEDFRFF